MKNCIKWLVIFMCASEMVSGFSQEKFATEQHFQELFVTAGYSTGFGAALGAAALGLTDQPGDKLRYVAVGASLGFIVGSMIGTYVIFTPSFSYSPSRYGASLGTEGNILTSKSPINISPSWDINKAKFNGISAQWLVGEF